TLPTPRPYLKPPDPLRSSQPACNDADKGAVQEKFRKREGWSRDQAPPRPAPRGHPGRDRSHGGPTRQAEESGRRSWEQPQGPRCCRVENRDWRRRRRAPPQRAAAARWLALRRAERRLGPAPEREEPGPPAPRRPAS